MPAQRMKRMARGAMRQHGARVLLIASIVSMLVLCWFGFEHFYNSMTMHVHDTSALPSVKSRLRFQGCENQQIFYWKNDGARLSIPMTCKWVVLDFKPDDPALLDAENPMFKSLARIQVVKNEGFDSFLGDDFMTTHPAFAGLIFWDRGNSLKYIAADLSEFHAVTRGEVLPFYRSEKIELPMVNSIDGPPVTDINAQWFVDNLDTGKIPHEAYFVSFHAPWCGHCRTFFGSWEQVAATLKTASGGSIGFFRLDVTQNDVPHEKIARGRVPVTYLFKKGEEAEPKYFDHSRGGTGPDKAKAMLQLGVNFIEQWTNIKLDKHALEEL